MPHKDPEARKRFFDEYRKRPEVIARRKAQGKIRYEKNKKIIIARAIAYNKKHGDYRYLTRKKHIQMFIEEQKGLCALCFEPLKIGRRSPYLDHCHETGKKRGALCNKCNVGLGMFGDKSENLLMAVAYLMRTGSQPSWNNFYGQ